MYHRGMKYFAMKYKKKLRFTLYKYCMIIYSILQYKTVVKVIERGGESSNEPLCVCVCVCVW